MRLAALALLLALPACGENVVCDDEGFIVSGVDETERVSRNLRLATKRLDYVTGGLPFTPKERLEKAEGCP